ncbi:retron St85 family RNA-directed DNA polymerase [Duganella sp. Dugasp56]|uniref:retron St85 family RNA-directed DNA polymerase n=1 Tax=Duganella sp. Dugasp56 TaxID=3243046 RepID=UPI0039B10EB6
MAVRLNPQASLLSLGIVQPASPAEVAHFIEQSLLKGKSKVDLNELTLLFERWKTDGLIQRVHSRENLYSLSASGNHSLSKEMRHLRDRTRLFLLKDLRNGSIIEPEEAKSELADVSSASLHDLVSQEEQRPISALTPLRSTHRREPAYWPLLGKQLLVGSTIRSSGTRFRFGSFPSLKACHAAHKNGADGTDFNISDLALGIGISARLVSSFTHNARKHYREFEIPKKSGGVRKICAPRTMLKVVQYWILDHILYKLPVHSACYSFKEGISIYDNAAVHLKSNYVANFDIKDYFPSITIEMLKEFLLAKEYGQYASTIIARLTTFEGVLPQGAPTSPLLSNAFLFGFDEEISVYVAKNGLRYTRYADDITISGEDRGQILSAIEFATDKLKDLKFSLNEKKTRIAGKASRQVVTGLVVNQVVQPTRSYRRQVRAMFHHASKYPEEFQARTKQLGGHLAYLMSFENIRETAAISKYKGILVSIRNPAP